MKLGHVRPEQLHVIADFRHGADSRPCSSDRVALFNRYSWRNTLNAVDLRLVHAVEELPSVRGKRLDISPLPLSKERIKSERALPGAAQTRNDDHLPDWKIEIEILQVVVPHSSQSNRWRGL